MTVETPYELLLQLVATVNANGEATIAIGPDMPLERWEIVSSQISNDGSNVCRLNVYNSPNPGTPPLEASYSGKLDTTDTQFKLYPGQKLYFKWTSATAGSQSSLTVRGRRFIKGDRGGGI